MTATGRAPAALVAALAASCAAPAPRDEPAPTDEPPQREEHVFYRPRDIGSDATFDPLSISIQYVLDSAQVENFDTDDYWNDLEDVIDTLLHPIRTIEDEGGFRKFVNKELFPIDFDDISDSKAILPNVALHTLGGGLVYRKTAEWFEAHDYPAPYVLSGTLAMVAEVLGEAVEKPTSDDTDEIADVYIFRPLGLWLYSDDDRARWIRRNLDPVAWPNLLMWDLDDEELRNYGLSYALRPPWLGEGRLRPFAYLGITNLFGLSHTLESGDALSWGLGTATETVNPTTLRFSGGLFWDRDGSLLASLLLNGAEGYAARINAHPGALFGRESPLGLFLAVADDGEAIVGVHYRLPVGLAY